MDPAAQKLFDDARRNFQMELFPMSLLDDCHPTQRVAYWTSGYIKAYWDRSQPVHKRTAVLSEIMAVLEEGNLRPGETISELVSKSASRLANREEHG